MELTPNGAWNDPATWVGGGGLLAGLLAAIKTILDARKDRGKQRQDAEGEIRDDLLQQNRELREEIRILREELAQARREINVLADTALERLRQSEDRAARFQRELAELRGQMRSMIKTQADHVYSLGVNDAGSGVE